MVVTSEQILDDIWGRIKESKDEVNKIEKEKGENAAEYEKSYLRALEDVYCGICSFCYEDELQKRLNSSN